MNEACFGFHRPARRRVFGFQPDEKKSKRFFVKAKKKGNVEFRHLVRVGMTLAFRQCEPQVHQEASGLETAAAVSTKHEYEQAAHNAVTTAVQINTGSGRRRQRHNTRIA